MKTFTFYVTGMHCNSCVVLTESELRDVSGVSSVKAHLNTSTIEMAGDFGDKTPEIIALELSAVLSPHGYTVSVDERKHVTRWSDFKMALPMALIFVIAFIGLQKLGIVNLVTASKVTYGTAFVIGLIASVSTCMAVVGGLVLSMSANFAKEGARTKPQALFHLGRLISFFVLGGVIGAIGSAFELGGTGTFILSLIVGIVLLILGFNLLDVFPWMKKLTPTLPAIVGNRIEKFKSLNHTLTPLLIGVATFFLPCGFTQSMQVYALSTGSFWTGALTMLAFALGTLPVLAVLSFSSSGIYRKAQSGIFFKTAGLVVIFFGVFNLLSALAAAGIIEPIFNI